MTTIKQIRQNLRLLVAAGLLILQSAASAQDLPQVAARFANPTYDAADRTYSVDVQLTSVSTPEVFFGMNTRFYYDATKLSFLRLDQFAPGQGVLRDAPKAYVGNDVSGVQLLGFDRAAGFVNGAVQVLDERYPFELTPGIWRKLCRVVFEVPLHFQDETSFCPGLVWDQKPFTGGGSLMGGSEGLLISVNETSRSTRVETQGTVVKGEPFNWQYRRQVGLPYGEPVGKECISLAQVTSVEQPTKTEAEGYVLFQNAPNPFDEQTTIEFILPYAQQAKINLYTVKGELLEVVDGYYPAGRSKVVLSRKPWMDRSSLVYYQLEVEDKVNLVRKMNMLNR